MPYTYNRKKDPSKPNVIAACLGRIAEGEVSVRQACLEFGLSKTTVLRHQQVQRLCLLLPSPGVLPSIPVHLKADIVVVARTAAGHGLGLMNREVVRRHWAADDELGTYLRKTAILSTRYPETNRQRSL